MRGVKHGGRVRERVCVCGGWGGERREGKRESERERERAREIMGEVCVCEREREIMRNDAPRTRERVEW